MSEIVITGATGAIGRRVVPLLRDAGHTVTAVTRADADVYETVALAEAFAGADVVVNLLTKVPPPERMAEPGAWDEHDRLRGEASAAVAQAATTAGARRLIQESLAFVYADGGDAWLDEETPVDATGRTATSAAAEANARSFAGDTVVLRFGFFTGDAARVAFDLEQARAGRSPWLGARDAYLATVWLEDAAAAVVAALDVPPGTYHVVDDEPATRGESDAALAQVAGVASLRGEDGAGAAIARSQRVSNARLQAASGWAPRVHGATEGWALAARGDGR